MTEMTAKPAARIDWLGSVQIPSGVDSRRREPVGVDGSGVSAGYRHGRSVPAGYQ
jgi:hypothetical protein